MPTFRSPAPSFVELSEGQYASVLAVVWAADPVSLVMGLRNLGTTDVEIASDLADAGVPAVEVARVLNEAP